MLNFSLSGRVVSFKFVELNDARLLCRVACAPDEAAMQGRPKAELALTETEREESVALALTRTTGGALGVRARTVLACADGQDSKAVALRQRVTPPTVGTWRARYVQPRFERLLDAPRAGAPCTIDDAQVDAAIAKTLESLPASVSALSRALAAFQSAIRYRRSEQHW